MNAMEIELKSKIDILEKKCDIELDSLTNAFQDRLENIKHDYETKLKDMERRFLLLISANERKHQFAFEELQIVCKNNEKIIAPLMKPHCVSFIPVRYTDLYALPPSSNI